jgi:hypothetical protein
MPRKLGKAMAFAVLIWIIGFVWGMVVFMTPALKDIPSIPYVSRYPAISFPILIISILVTYLLAKKYLQTVDDKTNEGCRLGITFGVVNFLLDLLVLVLLFGNGASYFASLTVWLVYIILLTVPWLVGRSLSRA